MATHDDAQSKRVGCPHLGQEYSPLEGSQLDNPYPFYARARREEPIFFSEGLQAWVVTCYDDVKRRTPGDDVVSCLLTTRPEGARPLDMAEMVVTLLGVLLAGHETTTNLIGTALYRTALREAQIRDITIPAGALLLLAYGSANRDEVQFSHPDQFDLYRSPNRHLAFGYGAHFCVGAPLARLEGRIALEVLSQRLPQLRLRPHQTLSHMPNLMFRGLKRLEVQWDENFI